MAAATLYRERFGDTPGIVYAAGVDHAYNLATAFRAAGLKAEAVSGRTPPVKLAAILAAYERGEIDVLINAMLLAEGWNSPRATVVMHLAPTASKRVYQQRIGRIMRIHPRKEAGIVVDFVPKGATHTERVVSLHSLLNADFYREGARVTPGAASAHAAPRRGASSRPANWLVPVTPDVARRLARDPARVAADRPQVPRRGRAAVLGDDRRPPDALRRAPELRAEVHRAGRLEGRARDVPRHLRGAEPEPPAAPDRARRPRLDARRPRRLRRPRHARHPGAALGEGSRRRRPHCCCARSPRASPTRPTRSSPAGRGSSRAPCARRSTARPRRSTPTRSGCSARSRTRAASGTRRTRPASSRRRSTMPREVGAALLATAEGYTPRATNLLDEAREQLGTIQDIAARARRRPARPEDRPDAHAPPPAPAQEEAAGRGGRRRERPSPPSTAPSRRTGGDGEAQRRAEAPPQAPAAGDARSRRARRRPSRAASRSPSPSAENAA